MKYYKQIVRELNESAVKTRAVNSQRYFKTGKGEYAEGDIFWGITVPQQRIIAKRHYREVTYVELEQLIRSIIHEQRLTALLMLVLKYKCTETAEQQKIYRFYLRNKKYINNWDLVDTSARDILGAHCFVGGTEILFKLAVSKNIWERRMAIIASAYFISQNKFDLTFAIADLLRFDTHDLIHKAVGWMLREVGKRDVKRLEVYLMTHLKDLPRTTLRYAIERFPEMKRKRYLMGTLE